MKCWEARIPALKWKAELFQGQVQNVSMTISFQVFTICICIQSLWVKGRSYYTRLYTVETCGFVLWAVCLPSMMGHILINKDILKLVDIRWKCCNIIWLNGSWDKMLPYRPATYLPSWPPASVKYLLKSIRSSNCASCGLDWWLRTLDRILNSRLVCSWNFCKNKNDAMSMVASVRQGTLWECPHMLITHYHILSVIRAPPVNSTSPCLGLVSVPNLV